MTKPISKPTLKILSLFPDQVQSFLDSSIMRRAQLKGQVELSSADLRSCAEGPYRAVDDTPYGGGPGMLFRADVLEVAMLRELEGRERSDLKVVYMTPRGAPLSQKTFEESAHWLVEPTADGVNNRQMLFVAGRYEGVDERWVEQWVDLELSAGDFVLTGGELPALMAVDGIVRLLPGVLGDERSSRDESFTQGLLEYAQYTKPREFNSLTVPEVLLGGHHQNIQEWKLRESLLLTFAYRPDLIGAHNGEGLPAWAQELLGRLQQRLNCRPK